MDFDDETPPPASTAAASQSSAIAAGDGAALSSAFGLETEVGRMMLSLYGRPKAPPRNWRTLKTAPLAPQPRLVAGAISDPTAATFDRARATAAADARPRPFDHAAAAARAAIPAPVDALRSRRSAASIAAATAREKPDVSARPLLRPGRDADSEKARLQATFAYRGGKGAGVDVAPLIDEATPMPVVFLGGGARAALADGGSLRVNSLTTTSPPRAMLSVDTKRAVRRAAHQPSVAEDG
jgi:hypothetical protein